MSAKQGFIILFSRIPNLCLMSRTKDMNKEKNFVLDLLTCISNSKS